METKEHKYHDRVRLAIFSLLMTAVLGAYIFILYDTQIVNGSGYLEQSVRNITQTVSVEASRGMITDRNGQALVSNRSTYSLTFDSSLLKKDDDENGAILRLIQLFQEREIPWEDNFPVTQTEPYTWLYDSIESAQQKRFCAYLKSLELISDDLDADTLTEALLNQIGLTPDILLERMREEYKIPDGYSAQDARLVLGVRYELAIRSLMNINAYVFAADVDTELISILTDGDYKGVQISTSAVREYNTDSAAHILGVMGSIFPEEMDEMLAKGYSADAQIGKFGVERAFEEYLHGVDGKRVVSMNSEGKITGEYYKSEPQPGSTVELTIDIDFQEQVEEILAKTVEQINLDGDLTRGASTVVVKVGTGEILAMANYPTYPLSSYYSNYTELSQNEGKPLNNRATQSAYAPGSTFKPCTAIAALAEGIITTTSTIQTNGHWVYPGAADVAGNYANCWINSGATGPGRNHGIINVTQAITNSCNYFFAEMGYQLGLDKLNEYANAFGLGLNTGIEIGDTAGNMPVKVAGQDSSPWAGFGQAEYSFTPLQLANYAATLAANGEHYTPHLLKTIRSYDDSQVLMSGDTEPQNTIEVADECWTAVKEGMLGLTTTGSLRSYFTSCVVEAGAKTGTAQTVSGVKNNGVFICFAPYDEPEIALAIVIERADAGANLASTAVDILNAYFAMDESERVVTGENELLK